MRKILLSAATVVAFVVYALVQEGGQPVGVAPGKVLRPPQAARHQQSVAPRWSHKPPASRMERTWGARKTPSTATYRCKQ